MFETIPNKPKFNEIEKEVLDFWQKNGVFEKSISNRERYKEFVIYEGPPTVNGKPGIHHLLTRTYKDIVGRFQTMNGRKVKRIAGWDEHGLPVELQVQKTLNLKTKKDICDFGIDNFKKQCRSSTNVYIQEWEKFTDRMGYWVDLKNAYRTSDPKYIENVKKIFEELKAKNLITEGYKIVPWDCGSETALSNSEVTQKEVVAKSLYVKFKVSGLDNTYALVWTTTPWTLPANVAIAYNKNINYVIVEDDNTRLIVSEKFALANNLKIIPYPPTPNFIVHSFCGYGAQYKPLFACTTMPTSFRTYSAHDLSEFYKFRHADFVDDIKGTGLVHIAPEFGEDDYKLWLDARLPELPNTIDDKGYYQDNCTAFAEQNIFNKDKNGQLEFNRINKMIKDFLGSKQPAYPLGAIYKEEDYLHTYPYNSRTDNPLIYKLRKCTFVKATELKEQLIKNNEKVNWVPSHIKHGRFGEWINTTVDWCVSRERYWGTPLNENSVLDCWFDSGAMPFAAFDKYKQADLICEGQDQTRGWFYTLAVLGAALKNEAPYKNVLCTGLVLDKNGHKMAKSKGNVVDPWKLFEQYGADAVRWYMASHQVGNPVSFDETIISKSVFKFFNQLWNCVSFFVTYANLNNITEVESSRVMVGREYADWWMAERVASVAEETMALYTNCEFSKVVEKCEFLVEDLSNIWIRYSRNRMSQNGDSELFILLYRCLITILKIIAPIIPMISEYLFKKLNPKQLSIHLSNYPYVMGYRVDKTVSQAMFNEMDKIKPLLQSARQLRSNCGVSLKQPLKSASLPIKLEYFKNFVKSELNVKEVLNGDLSLDLDITQELLEEGLAREFVRSLQVLRTEKKLKIGERINLQINFKGNSELEKAYYKHRDYVLDNVCADSVDVYYDGNMNGSTLKVNSKDILVNIISPESQFERLANRWREMETAEHIVTKHSNIVASEAMDSRQEITRSIFDSTKTV